MTTQQTTVPEPSVNPLLQEAPEPASTAVEPTVELPAPALETAAPQPAPVAQPPASAVQAPAVQPPPAPGAIPADVQNYIARLQAQAAATQQQADLQLVAQTVTQYAQQIENQYGLAPESARSLAQQHVDILYQQYQRELSRQGQVNAALAIAQQYGVDPRPLMTLASPDAMRQAAMGAAATTTQQKELAALRAEVATLKQRAVPSQKFDTGTVAPTGSLAGDDLERAWLKFDVENPTKSNPYDAQYRALLGR